MMLGQIPFGVPAANIGYNTAAAFNPNPYFSHISGPGGFSPHQSSTLGGSYYPGVNEVLVGGTGEFRNMYVQPSLVPPYHPSNFQRQPTPLSSVERARTKVLRDSRQDLVSSCHFGMAWFIHSLFTGIYFALCRSVTRLQLELRSNQLQPPILECIIASTLL
jgi:hypothetical protein